MATMREASKQTWTSANSVDHINAGSLQRIADATELMAQSYASVIADRDLYKRWYDEEFAKSARLERRIAALRGVITKLKRGGK